MMKRSSILFLFISLLCTAVVNGSVNIATATGSGDISINGSVTIDHSIISNNFLQKCLRSGNTVMNRLPGHLLRMHFPEDGLTPGIIEGPNDDILRERTFSAKHIALYITLAQICNFNESIIWLDATPSEYPASYSFSSTAFHGFLFRLKPF